MAGEVLAPEYFGSFMSGSYFSSIEQNRSSQKSAEQRVRKEMAKRVAARILAEVRSGSDRDLTVSPRRSRKTGMHWDLTLIADLHPCCMLISLDNRGDEHGNRA